MKKSSILLIPIVFFLLFVTSCKEETLETTITIEEPMDGETIQMADCGNVHIHIDFMSTDELHEVKVELHPEGNSSELIIDFEQHSHDKEYTFEQEVSLCSYASGTVFHLHAEAYLDHDGNETVTKEVEFTLQ